MDKDFAPSFENNSFVMSEQVYSQSIKIEIPHFRHKNPTPRVNLKF